MTLVPPVNVSVARIPEALALLRRAAASTEPFELTLGPVTSFRPDSPTLYLAVGGDDPDVAALHRLRDAVFEAPLHRELAWHQAQYHFLCGYTSKLAGTERGITEPVPSFSPAFGEAFLTVHPTIYATELVKKMDQHDAKAYLVNTGWNGTGKRISIKDTRAIIDAIIDGSIEKATTAHIPVLNLTIPVKLNNVSEGILDPRDTYADKGEWEKKARDLSARYIKNFQQYTDTPAGKALIPAGPQL